MVESGEVKKPVNSVENALVFLNEWKQRALGEKFHDAQRYFNYLFLLGRNKDVVKALNGISIQPTKKFTVCLGENANSLPDRFLPHHVIRFNDRSLRYPLESHYTEDTRGGPSIEGSVEYYSPMSKEGRGDVGVFYDDFRGKVYRSIGESRGRQAFNQLANLTQKGVIAYLEKAIKAPK